MKDEIYFSVAEKEIMDWMVNQVGASRIEAFEAVLGQKRELAYMHMKRGNYALHRQILKEICEWTEEMEEKYKETEKICSTTKIILP